MKKLLLNLYFWPAFALVSLFSLCVLPFLLIFSVIFMPQSTARVVRKSIRLYGWLLVRIVPFMAPITVKDLSGGLKPPVIFVANHYSSIDPYLFGMLPFENAFVTSWPFRILVFKWGMQLAHYINTEDGWEGIQEQGEKLLASGCSIIIWPEGHRSRDGRLARFKNGAFGLACSTGTSIVPVCILGTDRVMPPGSRFLTPGRVKMVILPPIIPSGRGDDPDCIRALKDQARESIATELAKQGVNFLKITGCKSDMMSDPITSSAIHGND
jgi:1-acyl-sn-glycerol-3-phosphate acyltransferase